MSPRLGRWLPVLVVVLALAFASLAAAGSGFTGRELPPPPRAEGVGQPPAATDGPLLPRPPGDGDVELAESRGLEVLYWIFVTAVGLMMALVLGYLLYLGLRRLFVERVRRDQISGQAASQPDTAAEAAEMRDALRAGLADIDAGGDARRAVIACWLRLERVAAAAGTARLAADTPADLVRRLLSRHLVSRAALEQLAEAYRMARYAPAEVGAELVGVARRALRDVDAALAEQARAGEEAARQRGPAWQRAPR
jgi:hypothetical protein